MSVPPPLEADLHEAFRERTYKPADFRTAFRAPAMRRPWHPRAALNSAWEADSSRRLPSAFRPSPKHLPTVAKAPSDRRRAPSFGDLCRRMPTHAHMS